MLPPERTETDFAGQDGIDQAGREIGLQVLTVPEGQRVMLIKSPDDVERACAPRESDEGMNVSEGLSFSLPGGGDWPHPPGGVKTAPQRGAAQDSLRDS